MQEDRQPKIFISYSWTSDVLVMELAERLVSHGVDVVLDKWELKEGQDKYAFMEQSVNDPSVDKVLIAGGGLTTIGEACECVVNGGIVINVNYLGTGEHITIPRVAWNVGMGHKTIKGGLTPGGRYRMEKLARLLQTKKLDVNPIITHRLEGKFEEIAQSLAMMKDKPKNLIKPAFNITW